jgi:long-chain acyl-CoA synthetase
MIIRGGYNVYPREIEEVLYEHPAVLEAAVIGVPDEEMGEEVGAAVVLRPTPTRTPTRSAPSSRAASPPTSTPAGSGSSTSCPRPRRGRSSSARSRSRRPRSDDGGAGHRHRFTERHGGPPAPPAASTRC